MARQNISKVGQDPRSGDLMTVEVVERRQVSPHFARVTVGGGEIERFVPLGSDQWFRLFLPVSDTSLARAPKRLTMTSYLRYLTVAKTDRAVIRNYTVRAFRDDAVHGRVIDVDFVVHGEPGTETAGPAATWAQTCAVGDPVGILDQGCGFAVRPDEGEVRLVGDESALPAVAGILASLPDDARGEAVVEVPHRDDRQDLTHPAGVEVTWLVRDDVRARPGSLALAHVLGSSVEGQRFHGFAAGESRLATGVRRHWVAGGVPASRVAFCGYWRADT